MAGPKRAVAEQRRLLRSKEAPSGEPEAVRLWLLGAFKVSVGHRSIGEKEWRLKKAGSLLKLLALAPGHRLHRERAMEQLWPGLDPKATANNLHYAMHVARRTLESAAPENTASRFLTFRGELLALCPDGLLWVDVEAFERAAATARRSREPAAYRAALELYIGDLLPEDVYESWAEEKREQLRRSYHALLLELAGLHEEREEYGPAGEALRRAAAEEPTGEEAHAGLMRLYALTGRHHEAILQYERFRKARREQLNEEPGAEIRRLYEEIRAGKFPAAPTSFTRRPSRELLDPSPNNLPTSLTSFVGREKALSEVKRLLSMTRLLTLTGAGGSGKSRFALEVARDLLGAYPDGVWLVELAPLLDPALVPQAVARALGVREQPGRSLTDTLTDHLRAKDFLLVVDNCEHLVDAAARLAEALLESCPKLRILATSREPLSVPGEAVWTVRPLSLPDVERASSIESLINSEAVRLFLDRAHLRLPGFALSEANAGAVGRICRKLEGIPLAIELAAARMGALAVKQVAQRLEDSLKLLVGGSRTADPRHQSLRATLNWSHKLLSEDERKLFGRLSVFAGGWTLEAAEEVCSGEGIEQEHVLDILSKLVDKSLVVADASPGDEGALRYRMLEPLRQYGQERLKVCGEVQRVRERHADYYLALAEEADAQEPEFVEPRSVAWLKRMESEHDNLRAALSWALDREEAGEHEEELGLRLAVALYWFWYTHDYQSEGRRYLERAVSRRSNRTTSRMRARALIGVSLIALFQADYEASKVLMEEGLALCRELGDEEGIASALTELGYVAVLGQRDDIPLPAVIEELRELKPQVKNRNTLARLLVLEGVIAASRGDLEHSVMMHEESLELFREIRDALGITTCLIHLGFIALLKTDYEEAASLLREALRQTWKTDYKPLVQTSLYGLGCVAACLEELLRAVRLWGAVEGMQEAYGVHLTPITLSITDYEGLLAAARSQLGEEAWSGRWEEGKAMPLQRAIEYALLEEEEEWEPPKLVPEQEQPPASERAGTLTRREREVAALVARGLTSRQIAAELSISEHTVDTHVRRILKKLGLNSRARIGSELMRS
jgi:predicted ATPase/DNA-binding SARP family transcriptional activator/DNA-binding CsgD family transcriptional regulator